MEYHLRTISAFYDKAKRVIEQCGGRVKSESNLLEKGDITLNVVVNKEDSKRFEKQLKEDYRFELMHA